MFCMFMNIDKILGLLPVIFRKILTELRPLIDVKLSFPLNILRTKVTESDQTLYAHQESEFDKSLYAHQH